MEQAHEVKEQQEQDYQQAVIERLNVLADQVQLLCVANVRMYDALIGILSGVKSEEFAVNLREFHTEGKTSFPLDAPESSNSDAPMQANAPVDDADDDQ